MNPGAASANGERLSHAVYAKTASGMERVMKISDEVLDRMALLALDDPWLKQRVKHARMQAAGDVLLRSLTPEDLDTLAQRLGFELAKKTDDRCSSRFDTSWLEGYTQGWNDRHEKMMSWRDAEMGDG